MIPKIIQEVTRTRDNLHKALAPSKDEAGVRSQRFVQNLVNPTRNYRSNSLVVFPVFFRRLGQATNKLWRQAP